MMSQEAKEARRAYQREYVKAYYAKHPEKRKETNRRYWENKAARMKHAASERERVTE